MGHFCKAPKPPVVRLMEKAFSREAATGLRPTATEWIGALGELETGLKRCGTNASHYYFAGLSSCPWCRVEAATGAVLFNFYNISGSDRAAASEIAAVWKRITAVQPPEPAPALLDRNTVGPIRASDEAVAIGRAKAYRSAGVFAVIIAIIGFCVFKPTAWPLWVIGGLCIALTIWNRGAISAKAAAFAIRHRTLEAQHRSIKGRWDSDASDLRFAAKMRELEGHMNQWKELPALRQGRHQQLERERASKQLERFLETFTIDQASIPGIGPGRRVVLESYSIETAQDISLQMKVPGFGPALMGALMEWRRSIEQQFRFDAKQGVDPRDIANLEREIAELRRKLEQSLSSGSGELIQIRNHVLAERKALETQVNDAFKAMLQAEADKTAAIE
jgi:DNA-binding helix-hairpin-helix protein with protein kinase domain